MDEIDDRLIMLSALGTALWGSNCHVETTFDPALDSSIAWEVHVVRRAPLATCDQAIKHTGCTLAAAVQRTREAMTERLRERAAEIQEVLKAAGER